MGHLGLMGRIGPIGLIAPISLRMIHTTQINNLRYFAIAFGRKRGGRKLVVGILVATI